MANNEKRLSMMVKMILSVIIGYWLFIQYNLSVTGIRYEFKNITEYSDAILVQSFQNNTAPLVLFFAFISWFAFDVLLKRLFNLFLEKAIKPMLVKLFSNPETIRTIKVIHFRKWRKIIRKYFYIEQIEVKKRHRKPLSYFTVKKDVLNIVIMTLNVIVAAMVLNLYIPAIYYFAIGLYILFLLYWFAAAAYYYILYDFTEKITTHEYDLYKKTQTE